MTPEIIFLPLGFGDVAMTAMMTRVTYTMLLLPDGQRFQQPLLVEAIPSPVYPTADLFCGKPIGSAAAACAKQKTHGTSELGWSRYSKAERPMVNYAASAFMQASRVRTVRRLVCLAPVRGMPHRPG